MSFILGEGALKVRHWANTRPITAFGSPALETTAKTLRVKRVRVATGTQLQEYRTAPSTGIIAKPFPETCSGANVARTCAQHPSHSDAKHLRKAQSAQHNSEALHMPPEQRISALCFPTSACVVQKPVYCRSTRSVIPSNSEMT